MLLALLRRDIVAMLAVLFLALVVLTALVGPWLIGPGATKMNLSLRNRPPVFNGGSVSHVFGTDPLGRDLLGRIALASRVSLSIAATVVVVSVPTATLRSHAREVCSIRRCARQGLPRIWGGASGSTGPVSTRFD